MVVLQQILDRDFPSGSFNASYLQTLPKIRYFFIPIAKFATNLAAINSTVPCLTSTVR